MRDPADLAVRCADSPGVRTPMVPPPGEGPASPLAWAPGGPRADAAADRLSDLLTRSHYRMFPPHLYPPVTADPTVLRATVTSPVGAGPTRQEALAWVCPAGRAFTIQEAHVRAATGFVPAAVGFRVTRNERVVFDGTEHEHRNPDGSTTTLPPLLPITAGEPVAFISLPWSTTILAGERLVVELVTAATAALTLTAQVQLRGYTYPLELLP